MAADRIPPTPSGAIPRAARALARVGWPKVWARLLRYATSVLRLAAMDAESAGVVEAGDLVGALFEKSLDGTLAWTLQERATDDEIVAYACTKLFGMRSTLRRKAARTVCDDALDERPDPGPDALARLMVKRGVVDLERVFERDGEASAYLREMLDGETRPEIVRTLGWPVARAKVVRWRIVRRTQALYAETNDDREDEPPSSGPRGPRRR
jgi:hypothetical protein